MMKNVLNIWKSFAKSCGIVLLAAVLMSALGADDVWAQTGEDAYAEAFANARNPQATVDCPTTDLIRAKYTSGCWSCLVVEKLSSAFLTAASKAYSVSQRAGLVLLGLGSVLWILLWGLRNVSSLTQLEPGNILNELMKFAFKVALAYAFIISGQHVVGKYFINPMMGVGAKIAETFWDKDKFLPYTEAFVWEDEFVSSSDEAKIKANFAASHSEDGKPVEALQLPKISGDGDEYEAIVQDFQKALVQLLNQRLQTLQQSCRTEVYIDNGQCSQKKSSSCRHSGCKDPGHHEAVSQIFADAGKKGTYGAYCQVTITAALEQLNKMVGGGITNFQTGIINCKDGMNTAAKYKNAAITAPDGGDISLKSALPYANIGDTIYIRVSGTTANQVGSASGYHAVTYIGGNMVISFNGDGKYNVLQAFGSGAVGKIVHMNEIIRQRLKAKPNAQIDRNALAKLAQGSGLMTLVNYSGGTFSAAGSLGNDSLIIGIPDIKYTGPEDIMSKSVMNSVLGATKAISDITTENMVLGDAIMCYAGMETGGAWHVFDVLYMTNFWMWIKGAFIWFTGLLLTLAVAYYLLDMAFKIGFAVIALPLAVGLWPFGITRDKVGVCLSIIAKAAASFAFLAIATTFTVQLTDAVFNYVDGSGAEVQDTEANDPNAPRGLAKLYTVYDDASKANKKEISKSDAELEADMEYVDGRLELFGTTFIMLLFAFLYSYKLIKATIPELTNKFFSDGAFGDQQPMHHMATMATKMAKDVAMKPVGWARDVAMYQSGRLAQGALGKAYNAFASRNQKDDNSKANKNGGGK